jgi:conjugal transfer pilin signal peptidase TrbI
MSFMPLRVSRSGAFVRFATGVRQGLAARWPRLRRTLPRDLTLLLWLVLLLQHVGLGWVWTDSVNAKVVLVLKNSAPHPGELAVFAYSGGQIADYYPDTVVSRAAQALGARSTRSGPASGDGFIKVLLGVEGDRIDVLDGEVFLHSKRGRHSLGRCKAATRHGHPLRCVQPQVIPAGQVYMWSPHADALDSRYSLMGLVPAHTITGKAVALW